ncbi:MAG: Ppx/GppA phosphatase family protein [bacterium]
MPETIAETDPGSSPSTIAAIDLGSNSFHLLVARSEHGELRPIEMRGEKVQLASDMVNGHLNTDAMSRGLSTLAQYRQALDTLQPDVVRVVATNALRAAKNARQFAAPAEAVIGYPIEIISGREEARLVYLGVAHTLADDDLSRLVIDIGGGSTEFIIGERFESRVTESLHMGCVSYRDRFFKKGVLNKKNFDAAYKAACVEVLNIARQYKEVGWVDAVGSSGTMRAVEQVIAAEGLGEFSRDNIKALKKKVLSYSTLDELGDLAGMKESRITVFASGLAIICAIVDTLGIDVLKTSTGALREGVAYDLLGRLQHEDVRERSVNALMMRYGVDDANASRLADLVRILGGQAQKNWALSDEDLTQLGWAARLHELGMSISHTQFHKHGQYLIEASDLPGFSTMEQKELAVLVRSHRQKFPVSALQNFPKKSRGRLCRLSVLLRLANILKYIPLDEELSAIRLKVKDDMVRLDSPVGWIKRHPLTEIMLADEVGYLAKAGYSLVYK